jgi:hypothetical protein
VSVRTSLSKTPKDSQWLVLGVVSPQATRVQLNQDPPKPARLIASDYLIHVETDPKKAVEAVVRARAN